MHTSFIDLISSCLERVPREHVWSVLGSASLQMMLLCWQLHMKLLKHLSVYCTGFLTFLEYCLFFLAVSCNVSHTDKRPFVIENGGSENFIKFQYLGSMIAVNGLIDTDIDIIGI